MIRLPRVPRPVPATPLEEVRLDTDTMRVPHRIQTWIVTARCEVTGQVVMRYRGPDVAAARDAAGKDGTVLDGGLVWPTPEQADVCRCKGDESKQAACPWGHRSECHYPLTCGDADCGWINSVVESDADPLRDMLAVLDSDRSFTDSPDDGDLACACSRCGKLIASDAVRCRDLDGTEWRYHQACIMVGK